MFEMVAFKMEDFGNETQYFLKRQHFLHRFQKFLRIKSQNCVLVIT